MRALQSPGKEVTLKAYKILEWLCFLFWNIHDRQKITTGYNSSILFN